MDIAYDAHLVDANAARGNWSHLTFVEVAPRRPATDRPDPFIGSIPNAHLTAITVDFAGTPTASSGRMPLPSLAAIRNSFAHRGIGPRDSIVLYTRRPDEFSSATRAWFTLTWAGFASVRIMEGGLPAWVAAGGDLDDSADSPRETGAGHARADGWIHGARRVLDADHVLELSRHGTVLDSRPAHVYSGVDGEPRTGHVPHAIHAPSTDLLDADGRLLAPGALRRWFLARSALGNHEIGAYCGGGVSSSVLVFVGALLGQDIGLYVDSWSAWQQDLSLPVEQGTVLSRSPDADLDCI